LSVRKEVFYYQDRDDDSGIARSVRDETGTDYQFWNYEKHDWVSPKDSIAMDFCHDYDNTRVISEEEAKKAIEEAEKEIEGRK